MSADAREFLEELAADVADADPSRADALRDAPAMSDSDLYEVLFNV